MTVEIPADLAPFIQEVDPNLWTVGESEGGAFCRRVGSRLRRQGRRRHVRPRRSGGGRTDGEERWPT
jgi:hypothetical protein